MERSEMNAKETRPKSVNQNNLYSGLQPLHLLLKKQAQASNRTKKRLTNRQYMLLPKEQFLEMAWEYYTFSIYHYAKNMSGETIPLENLYQEAFFVLHRAYDNYKPQKGGNFYHFILRDIYIPN